MHNIPTAELVFKLDKILQELNKLLCLHVTLKKGVNWIQPLLPDPWLVSRGLIRIDTSNLNYYAFICLIFIICLSIKSSFVHSTEKNATMRQSLDTPYSVQQRESGGERGKGVGGGKCDRKSKILAYRK